MKTNTRIWKTVLFLFAMAIVPLVLVGCKKKSSERLIGDRPATENPAAPEFPEVEHPAGTEHEHPAGSEHPQ